MLSTDLKSNAAARREPAALSEIALTGVYEISKILTSPARLEVTLANVLNLLSSFMQMRDGVISLLDDDSLPEIIVGAGWREDANGPPRPRIPEKAVGQIIATAMPLVVQNIAAHPLFDPADVEALSSDDGATVSFIGVPIRADGKVVGTLTIDRIWDGASMFRFDSDVRFLAMIANLVGQTIQLHRVVARDRERLMVEHHRLQKELSEFKPPAENVRADGILGESKIISSLLEKIAIVAKSHAPVHLRGESGTGKELFARAIHDLSPCAKGPFIKINCAALPESVLESELFGHEKGAFTGAINSRKGRFELADKGTLFLDEIGEISASFQAKLLRVLQEGEFERVGGTKTIKVNVRLVTATNRNLEDAVAKNEFRADLYYRISVVPMMLPALRERKGDIPVLASEFLKRFNTQNKRSLTFTEGAVNVLTSCYFPGNVRELDNCVQRTATLATGKSIVADDFACQHNQCLSAMLWKGRESERPQRPQPARPALTVPLPVVPRRVEADPPPRPADVDVGVAPETMDPASMTERDRLIDAMDRCGWVQAKAARILGLTPRQIGYALKKHDIEIKRF
jgi:Nif-specific regulatory protein